MLFALMKEALAPRKKHDDYAPYTFTRPLYDAEHGFRDSPSVIGEKVSARPSQTTASRITPRMISDATIGLSDGLTVPFALTAGLSALGDTNVVIYGGLAELIAGGISMGLGGYLGAKGEAEAYLTTREEVRSTVANDKERASAMVRATVDEYAFSEQTLQSMVASLLNEPSQMVEFLMRFHLQLALPEDAASRPYICGLTIAIGYSVGGLIALLPYIILRDIHSGFIGSVAIMAITLFAFGWLKTTLVGEKSRKAQLRAGLHMMMLGGVAAGAAMGCVKAIGT